MIHVFGNSHAHFFTGSQPGTFGIGEFHNENFKSYSLGPVIAYNFYEHHYPNLKEILLNINFNKDTDYILLAIGEVDCRWHLPLQCKKQQRMYQDVVQECIDRFFRTYIDLQKSGYRVIGWGGHPSSIEEHDDNPNKPVFGNCLYRNMISKHWDLLMSNKCQTKNIEYISIIDELIDSTGLTKMEYFIDYCHLDHEKAKHMVLDKLKQKNLI